MKEKQNKHTGRLNQVGEHLSCICAATADAGAGGKCQSPLGIDLRLSLKRIHQEWMHPSSLPPPCCPSGQAAVSPKHVKLDKKSTLQGSDAFQEGGNSFLFLELRKKINNDY